MQDILTQISQLTRPTLLVRTARHGMAEYSRTKHLCRLLKTDILPGHAQAIVRLMDSEAATNQLRLTQRAEYSVVHHVDLIIALMCEARSLKVERAARLDLKAPTGAVLPLRPHHRVPLDQPRIT